MRKSSHEWLSQLTRLRDNETPCVLITVVESKGSTPRDAGTKMIATADQQFGTIGGGNLEFQAIEQARQLLTALHDAPTVKNYALGPSLAQCCGGAVTILLEPFFSPQKTVMLFGAGHVGKAVVDVLHHLPVRIHWVDERDDEFPKNLPDNVRKVVTATPVAELRDLPDDAFVLVMTHNHDLDYDIVETALAENSFAYLGLIGSDTKKVKFKKRLAAADIDAARIKDMVCPIGIAGIKGKHPREIAISVAAELLQYGLTQITAQAGNIEQLKNSS